MIVLHSGNLRGPDCYAVEPGISRSVERSPESCLSLLCMRNAPWRVSCSIEYDGFRIAYKLSAFEMKDPRSCGTYDPSPSFTSAPNSDETLVLSSVYFHQSTAHPKLSSESTLRQS